MYFCIASIHIYVYLLSDSGQKSVCVLICNKLTYVCDTCFPMFVCMYAICAGRRACVKWRVVYNILAFWQPTHTHCSYILILYHRLRAALALRQITQFTFDWPEYGGLVRVVIFSLKYRVPKKSEFHLKKKNIYTIVTACFFFFVSETFIKRWASFKMNFYKKVLLFMIYFLKGMFCGAESDHCYVHKMPLIEILWSAITNVVQGIF